MSPTHLVTVEFRKSVSAATQRGHGEEKTRRVVYACPSEHMGPVRKLPRPTEDAPYRIKAGVDAAIVSIEPAPEGLPASTRPAYPDPKPAPKAKAKGGK